MLADPIQSYWLTWFPGALLATFGLLALMWKGIRAFVKMQEAGEKVMELEPIVREMHAQFSNNGGHSMRDAIDRSEAWQRKHAREDDHRFAKVEASLERIEDHLTG